MTGFHNLVLPITYSLPANRQSNFPPLNLIHANHRLRYNTPMPSFDIVSTVNPMEIENAVNQSKKEIVTRFDFKDAKAEIILEKNEIKLSANNEYKMLALVEIVVGKLSKRSISLKSVDQGQPDVSPLGHARQTIKIKQGLEPAVAKEISQFVRDTKLKATAAIEGDKVRVASKNRDDLQSVIAACRAHEFPAALSYINFRD